MKKWIFISLLFGMALPPGNCQDNREYFLKGMADLQMQKNESAIENLTIYLESDNMNHMAYLFRAEAYFNLKEWDKALSDFITAESIKPGSGNLGLARTYASKGNAALAIQYLESHLRSGYRVPEKVILLDKAFENIENSREWRGLWHNDWYTDSEHILRDLEYLIGNEQYAEASGILEKSIQMYPEKDEFYYQKARIHMARKEFKQALSQYDLALKYAKDHPDYLTGKADVLQKLKRHKEAITALSRAIYVNQDRLDLYMVRARLYYEN
ncbi:MAG: tetratricopeptide repeat protein, partial [Bacteroidales bacterium]